MQVLFVVVVVVIAQLLSCFSFRCLLALPFGSVTYRFNSVYFSDNKVRITKNKMKWNKIKYINEKLNDKYYDI